MPTTLNLATSLQALLDACAENRQQMERLTTVEGAQAFFVIPHGAPHQMNGSR